MKIIEKEFNVITGETTITERDETADELKARELYEAEQAALAAAQADTAAAKAALLAKLGITEDEAKLLLS
jgi:hypothetical protein